jgi:hypothetical protein
LIWFWSLCAVWRFGQNQTEENCMFEIPKNRNNYGANIAFVLFLLLSVLTVLSPARLDAQNVTCSAIDPNHATWPAGSGAQGCGPNHFQPAGSNQMLMTLQGFNNPNPDSNTNTHYVPDAFARMGGSSQTTAGDVLSITIFDSSLPGGLETVSYTTVAGDTLMSAAAGLWAAINNDNNLQSIGEIAYPSGATVVFKLRSGNAISQTSNGSTENITLVPDPNYSGWEDATLSSNLADMPFSTFYIFANQNDFTNWPLDVDLSTNPPQPLNVNAGAMAITPRGATTNVYHWSAIFGQNGAAPRLPNPNVPNVTAHEAGHHLDYLYGNQQIIPTATNYVSDSDKFQKELDADFAFINQSSACSFDSGGSSHTAYPGLFTYMKDAQGNYICATGNPSPYQGFPNGTGPGDGWNLSSQNGPNPAIGATYQSVCIAAGNNCNRAVLEAAFGDIFDGTDAAHERREIFAELFAVASQYFDSSSYVDLLLGAFPQQNNAYGILPNLLMGCTEALVQGLAQNGTNFDLSQGYPLQVLNTPPTSAIHCY